MAGLGGFVLTIDALSVQTPMATICGLLKGCVVASAIGMTEYMYVSASADSFSPML